VAQVIKTCDEHYKHYPTTRIGHGNLISWLPRSPYGKLLGLLIVGLCDGCHLCASYGEQKCWKCWLHKPQSMWTGTWLAGFGQKWTTGGASAVW